MDLLYLVFLGGWDKRARHATVHIGRPAEGRFRMSPPPG
jgi:hypothetical protein